MAINEAIELRKIIEQLKKEMEQAKERERQLELDHEALGKALNIDAEKADWAIAKLGTKVKDLESANAQITVQLNETERHWKDAAEICQQRTEENVWLRQQLDGYNQLQDVFNNAQAGGACHDHSDCEACLHRDLENSQLRDALTRSWPIVCSAMCPSVKRTGEPWPHSEVCKEIEAALTVPPAPAVSRATDQFQYWVPPVKEKL